MRVHSCLDNRETQSVPVAPANVSIAEPLEWLKEPVNGVVGNDWSAIANGEDGVAVSGCRDCLDPAMIGIVLKRVVDRICHEARDQPLVARRVSITQPCFYPP